MFIINSNALSTLGLFYVYFMLTVALGGNKCSKVSNTSPPEINILEIFHPGNSYSHPPYHFMDASSTQFCSK